MNMDCNTDKVGKICIAHFNLFLIMISLEYLLFILQYNSYLLCKCFEIFSLLNILHFYST